MTYAVRQLLKGALALFGYSISRSPKRRYASGPGLPKLTGNIYLQNEEVSLPTLLRQICGSDRPPMSDRSVAFVHVVNPFAAPERMAEQQLAFESMRQARMLYESRCRAASAPGSVKFVAAAFEEDQAFAGAELEHVVLLRRSALDLASFRVPRKLPILLDVIEAGCAKAAKGDFLVYTNSDICLAPSFYGAVALLLSCGIDAISINRRTIEPFAYDPGLLPLMAASLGSKHPGFDCFVFPADWFDSFVPTHVLSGAAGVDRWPLYNMVTHAQKMLLLNSVHLTFHIGDDQAWTQLVEYAEFNIRQLKTIYARLPAEKKERLRAFCHAYGDPPGTAGIPP